MNPALESLVLSYHAVSPDWPCSLAVRPEALRSQVESLLERGFEPVTFADLANGREPGPRSVAITFDDAYRSLHRHALPVLSELGVPATVFVPTALAGRERPMAWKGIDEWAQGPHRDELLPLTWDQLGLMRELGWEVGSHTRTHPHLPGLSDSQLAEELEGSREDCRRELGSPSVTLAFPYGETDARVSAAAERAGYAAAASMSPAGRDRFNWPRVGVYPIDGPRRFRLKTSRWVRRFRGTGLGALVERGRYALPALELAPLAEESAAVAWAL